VYIGVASEVLSLPEADLSLDLTITYLIPTKMASALSPTLLRKLRTAANASKPFIEACKRALDQPQPDISASFAEDESFSLSQSQTEDQSITEDELQAWRDATERTSRLVVAFRD